MIDHKEPLAVIKMFGMQSKFVTKPAKRAELLAILLEAAEVVGQLPGSQLYLVAEDMNDDDALHVIEAWDDQAAHAASLQDEQVQALIARARPLLGDSPSSTLLTFAGGFGLAR